MTDRCSIPGYRADAALDYLDHGVCDDHWNKFMDGAQPPGALRAALGMTEDTMAKKKQSETPNTEPATEAAVAPEAAAASEVAPKRKRTPKDKHAEVVATAPVAAEKAAPEKPFRKRAKAPAPDTAPDTTDAPDAPKPDLVVFAFRLTQAERDAIHATAGPRNATQFVRRVGM